MKLLFDQNISYRVAKKLQDVFPGCSHVSDCSLSNCDDIIIWQFARDNNYVLVTFDSDFYDISLIHGHPPKIIWIRTGNLSTQEFADLFVKYRDHIVLFIEGTEFMDIACLEIDD
jgi:predicted nuclease of predicted toxin-antitoxin system